MRQPGRLRLAPITRALSENRTMSEIATVSIGNGEHKGGGGIIFLSIYAL